MSKGLVMYLWGIKSIIVDDDVSSSNKRNWRGINFGQSQYIHMMDRGHPMDDIQQYSIFRGAPPLHDPIILLIRSFKRASTIYSFILF